MKAFSALFADLDSTNKTRAKLAFLADYFRQASKEDLVWAVALLSHRRPRRLVASSQLRSLAGEVSGIPPWLFEETYHTVGDLAETISLLVKEQELTWDKSLSDTMILLRAWSKESEEQKLENIASAWRQMTTTERLVFNKLLTGGFRMGISQKLMTRALHMALGVEEDLLALRLMGDWDPYTVDLAVLLSEEHADHAASRPYPFCLAHGLDQDPEDLGPAGDFIAEWKWDGIRAQIVRRHETLHIWSRGEELITPQFPEWEMLNTWQVPDFVLDGEIIASDAEGTPSFAVLQTRIGRKKVSKRLLQEAPARFIAYDLLEYNGEDLRQFPFEERIRRLDQLLQEADPSWPLRQSEVWVAENWADLQSRRRHARENHAEGLMLKHRASTYPAGRKKGHWWKWKLEPMHIDAVLMYAQSGHGRRANLYTDYTFGVWDGDQLVPFTKAYSGLTDREFEEVSRFVRQNSRERFGPVRSVEPLLVFEIGFEGIQASKRHKSGIALRFPRMLRWRKDKPASEAGTLEELKRFLEPGK
jgi:DNA ligase 1